ncbi:leucyl aminopeptidase [Thiohalobacter sp. IOR34]|uniref:leucyl aminopeptidase n=1 Tax=Thiohalobacter sp. IOR34 TaxID=3057176 RepID=UPI0025B11276|nr:leucyl aminopeptidase [Thiohalobacter sp. IOR34]WJW74915.1 leucyl aminopeptidase [Thiohalobacter sp. IOR34]
MDFNVTSGTPEKQRTACLVIGVFEPRRLTAAGKTLNSAAGGHLAAILRRGDLEGKCGQTLLLHNVPGIHAERVLLVGCGREKELDEGKFRSIAASAAQRLDESGANEAVSYLSELPVGDRDLRWKVRQQLESTEDALYVFDRLRSEKEKKRRPLKKLTLAIEERTALAEARRGLAEGAAIAAGVRSARELGNLPGNICTPDYLARQAKSLARRSTRIDVRVLEERGMQRLGMGALLSVARGSRQPAKLIILEYRGGRKNARPVALVGKGVTFDSGGISLKPGQAMDEMKFDMCGAAAVLGTFEAVLDMQLPINLVGIIPATENLPDGQASKPGDVVTSMSGQTIEILNTDAEGRLILCDALTYAGRFKPDTVIDVATLTGACVIALGSHAAGLLANDQDLASELLDAGSYAADRAWQMPLWEDYQQQLDSNFADMANIGGREAGTITAACFLSRFTKDYRWAHLDIAGVAWKHGKEKGATGRPVPLLTQYLLDRCSKKTKKRG